MWISQHGPFPQTRLWTLDPEFHSGLFYVVEPKRDVDAVCHTFTTPARRKDNTEQITFVASLEQQPENTALVSCRPLSLCEGWVLTPESLKE